MSIFSDLNNLIDLTMFPPTATLLGYTHEELRRYFPETLAAIGAANGLDAEGAFKKVIEWYDGYRFEEKAERVINPVSFGLCARSLKFQNYWSTTATPTFLIDALAKHPLDLRYMRQFYLAFPICDALRHELGWTHYRILMREAW